ncbi:hypothetical protein BW723_05730 [Polaribacter reichenbachii]|uniref:PKD domain-containing protein n=1 Tax=Polaribacter reichenbachii TaxID=996801 RepID=A0A1B8TYS2_9FLAO|nr:hypothetical protein [Polaribacter reichenbachii]APZ45826.1 hypothetical protein BW723_05730 [Polaribacter reichenbachii]AUC19688.1 hypothetical protein BTO17_13745 [Polaribacter reichenbachii]OBY64742.1 hypothetical protein LPB301_09980 [Polaribacter reichenbachii]
MKNIKFLQFIFITTLLLFSCNDDDSVVLIESNHRAIVTSEMDFENTINVGAHIDFGDLSRGVSSRLWTFPENVTEISGEEGNTSTKDVVKGTFNEAGVYDVTLSQVFKGNVYPNEDSTEPIQGKELDTTIVVTVLDNITANIQINHINDDGSLGAELNLSDNAENEVTASKFVRLTQNSTGSPTNFTWNLKGAKPEQVLNDLNTPEVDVRYTKLGTWDLEFIASRTRPTDADTIYIKNFIKVIPSTDPVTLDRVFEQEEQTKIGLEFSREMDPATVNKSTFSVTIETANGATLTPELTNVTVDATEGNILIIELANEIMYNDDVVKVSYTPGGLTTLDAVASDAFTDVILTDFIKENLFDNAAFSDVDASFETSIEENWPYLWWGGQWAEYDMNLSFDRAHSGSKSMYIEFRPGGGMIIGNVDGDGDNITFPVEAGYTYEMGAWIYLEDLGSPDGVNIPDVRFYWRPGTNWGVAANPAFTSDFKVGEWIETTTKVTFAADGDVSYMIRGFNTGNTGTLKFYMDDLALYKLTSRP